MKTDISTQLKKFEIIIPTMKTVEEFSTSSTMKCLNKVIAANPEFQVTVSVCGENRTGLSELYQNRLNANKEDDIVLLMHDDLEIHDAFVFEKLLKAHEHYDIVGLAGSVSQDYGKNDVPMVWHLCQERQTDSRGIVSHYIPKGFNGGGAAHVNSAYFGPTPSSVVVIDGLFMSFKMSVIRDRPEVFNRNYTFHHYDLAMCINAVRNGLKIGVWPIYCAHHGLGEFANDKTWHKHAKEFKVEFGDYKQRI